MKASGKNDASSAADKAQPHYQPKKKKHNIQDFDSHENKKLTDKELQLIEYSFFSLSEEVDLFYCEQKEESLAFEILFNKESLQDKAMSVLDGLESYPIETDQWQSRLRQLYLLSMGVFRFEGDIDADDAMEKVKNSPKKDGDGNEEKKQEVGDDDLEKAKDEGAEKSSPPKDA